MASSAAVKLWPRRAVLRALPMVGAAGFQPAIVYAQSADTPSAAPEFPIIAGDIARIEDLGGRLHIALNEPARRRFSDFTASHIGQSVRVVADRTTLIEAEVRLQIDSGLFSSMTLDDTVRRRLLNFLTGQ